MSASGTPEYIHASSYVAALRSELGDAGTGRRMTALLNQKVLFPHRGQATLDPTVLTLGTWNDGADLRITKDAVSRITRQFDDYYGAFVGGASSAWGAPVIIEFTDGTAVYVLFDHRTFLEKTDNRNWEADLLRWMSA
ncbi:hypothetical protein [Corynebacterium variabile]|uniref:Uncharacterized protein n=1 Tax=Corynebacterium variabile TaxID=1727 RepID=A0A4Y4BZP8_9CORY|nr:hypothetical protein [Corynebacterium variabile]MDN6536488.1 hypothetical protein [Corynebacterium variabile]GEC85082.1 hypothetical protein CVA01_03960 [Corynebacterium variabile]